MKRLQEMHAAGRRVLMVGDGLNDAPALGAAFVSMSPSTAADVSQTAADFVFQGEELAPILEALRIARWSKRLVFQNFGMAFGYNLIAVPLAIMGLVTPLIAAIAMASSSLAVTGNALRLNLLANSPSRRGAGSVVARSTMPSSSATEPRIPAPSGPPARTATEWEGQRPADRRVKPDDVSIGGGSDRATAFIQRVHR